MASCNVSMTTRIGVLVVLVLLSAQMQVGSAQHCGCAKGQCCSQWGYCGTTKAYCGEGCQSGACYNKPPVSPAPTGTGVASIISSAFFNRIKVDISSACKGKAFYTYQGFITAANAFSTFGRTGTLEVQKRELAAFFANVARETGSLCYVEELSKPRYCTLSTVWPCQPGKSYYGRGPLQLTGNYNYGEAGKYLRINLLSNPDLVAQKPAIAFKTSIWYWAVYSNCHRAMTSSGGSGFAGTIRSINPGECGNPAFRSAVQSRVNYYEKFCSWLGVSPGTNLYC